MKIIQVVASIAEEATGPAYTVPRLAEVLGRGGQSVELHTLAPAGNGGEHYRVHSHPGLPFLRRLGPSPAMRRALSRAAGDADILHNHGLWMMPNIYAGSVRRGRGCKLVTSPRGMLSGWALNRSRWRKRLLWVLAQRRAVLGADCLHVTSEEELADVRALGFSGPVAVIPNGIDVPPVDLTEGGPDGRRRLLFLSRVHPKKGVDILLHSWQRLQNQFPDWELVVAGPDNGGYLGQMKSLAAKLGAERVTFPGAVYGTEKVALLRTSQLFILPTHSENFGVAVAEALAHGVPAIVTRGAPWSGLGKHDCGWWIEQDLDSVTACLGTALSLPPAELRRKGLLGRAWMERDFSWDRVGGMMAETYRWLLEGGQAPPWVVTDSGRRP